jgi:hypothetical protein
LLLRSLPFLPFTLKEFSFLDDFELTINNRSIFMNKFFVSSISDEIHKQCFQNRSEAKFQITISHFEQFDNHLKEFQLLFKGKHLALINKNVQFFKKVSCKLKMNQLHRACLDFEKREKERTILFSRFSKEDTDLLEIIIQECEVIVTENSVSLELLLHKVVVKLKDMKLKFPDSASSISLLISDENKLKSICETILQNNYYSDSNFIKISKRLKKLLGYEIDPLNQIQYLIEEANASIFFKYSQIVQNMNPAALYYIAQSYRKGLVVTKNQSKAIEYY